MPLLGALMVLLAGYAVLQGDAQATIRFLFFLDWEQVTARAALEALGLGFFSIGVGMGLMIAYAAYSDRKINLTQVALASVLADTAISLLAGFAVFPMVFAHGLDAAAGPGLMFVTLPLAFADVPFGRVTAVAFFLLLFVAALASAIATFELTISPLLRRWHWSRARATTVAGVACLIAGVPTILSFNIWSTWFPLSFWSAFANASFYDVLDYLTSNVLLPLGGLAMAIFAGWVLPGNALSRELEFGPIKSRFLRVALRFVVPAAIIAISLAPYFS
jgi:neurotransmitter:Na+ symporter, NSS family